jgi:phage shock protein E
MRIRKQHLYAAVFLTGTAIAGFSLRNADTPRSAEGAPAAAPTYLDVRTDAEWDEGHIDGAMHFDLEKLQQGEMPDLPKNEEIAIYCRSGKRAETAKGILEGNGFSRVKNVGGYDQLVSGGKKTCRGALARCE